MELFSSKAKPSSRSGGSEDVAITVKIEFCVNSLGYIYIYINKYK